MEATGNYGEALATYLYDEGFTVSVMNPAQIKSFAQSQLVRTKNDRTDSIVIAKFCQAICPKSWAPSPIHVRTLQTWLRRMEVLQDMHQQEMNRSYVASKLIQNSIKTVLQNLMLEIEDIKKKIKAHIEEHLDLREKRKLLETIPGVGEATIIQVLAFMGNVESFKNAKQFSAFVGLNPKQHQSGTSVRGKTRLSKTGNSNLRKAFYLPAITAKRHNPIVRLFCERLKMSGKTTMVIIGAAMRKLVHIIYGVLKTGKVFDASLATCT